VKNSRRKSNEALRDLSTWKFDPHAPSLWELIKDDVEGVPDEALANVPADLARNIDHYLYGLPKIDE